MVVMLGFLVMRTRRAKSEERRENFRDCGWEERVDRDGRKRRVRVGGKREKIRMKGKPKQ